VSGSACRAVHLVPTRRAAVDQRTRAGLAQAEISIATTEDSPSEAVVSLLPSPIAQELARRRRLPLLTLAVDGPSGFRHLDLPSIAAAGRSVVVALVSASAAGRPQQQLIEGAVKASGLAPHVTRQRILESCADWPARALADVAMAARRELPVARLTAAAPAAWLSLPVHSARNAVERARESLVREIWAVGIAPRPVASFLSRPGLDDVVWLPERSGGGFLADPFGVVGPDGPVLLVEAYVPERRRGEIVALRPDRGTSSPVRTGLDGHLSYPCLIEDGGAIYCLPENAASGRVTLLRAERFPDRFEPAAVLLEDFAGVDCTPFRHEGRWWLLAMDHRDQDVAKLFLFHADRLLGPWRPHRWNPVRCDLRNARPAGPPFLHEGQLYRPAQDCSRRYGGAVVLNRIDVLTTEWFHETAVARIEPDPAGRYSDGVHTLTPLGATRTLVDGKRVGARAWRE
jgi:hypothetical protein